MKFKKVLLTLSILIPTFIFSGCEISLNGQGEKITKEFSLGDKIDNLVIGGFYTTGIKGVQVNLIDSEQQKLEVVSYLNFIDTFKISLDNRTLNLSGGSHKIYNTDEIVFNIYGHRFMKIDVGYGATLSADDNCASPMGCTLNASGGSIVTLGSFYCYIFSAKITGGSKLIMGDLNSPNATFYADGGSSIKTSVLKGNKYKFELRGGSKMDSYSYVHSPIEEGTIELHGGSDFDCLGLAFNKCIIDFSGGSTGKAWVLESLEGNLSEGSNFTFAGYVADENIHVDLSGGSTLTRK